MSKDEISASEVQIIHWGQKIFIPTLSALLLIVIIAAFTTYQAVAQIELKMEQDDRREVQDKKDDEARAAEQKVIRHNQAEFKLEIQDMRIRQGYILDDIGEIKEQNTKILEILTK